MAVKHDNQGFLIGESVDLDKTFTLWNEIKDDLRAIRTALTGSSSGEAKIPKALLRKPESYSSAPSSTIHQLATPLARGAGKSSLGRPITKQHNDEIGAGKFLQPGSPLERKAITRNEINKNATSANRNTATGRFEKKNDRFKNRNVRDESVESSAYSNEEGGRVLSDAANKIVSAIGDMGDGMEDTDPTIKAFNEVSQPLSRGYEMLSVGNGIDEKRKERWFRRIFGELRLFRNEETLFNKVANRSLGNIEEHTEASQGGGEGGDSSWLLRYVLPAIVGIGALLVGSDKGLMAKLSAAHEKTMAAVSKPFKNLANKLILLIDGVSSKIQSAWSTFTGFVKDKLGIDINKALTPAVDTVKSGYQAAKSYVSSAMSRAYDTVEAGAGSVLESVMPAGFRTKKTFHGIKGGEDLGKYGSYTEAEAQRVRSLKTSAVNTSANMKDGMPPEIQAKIAAQAKKHDLDPIMMQKIAAMESGGNPSAISKTGAIGVFQFTGKTASGVGINNRFDVDQNIEGGMKLALENIESLSKSGLPVTAENLYMMHQIGPQAAKEVIRGAEKGISKSDLSRDTQDKMNLNYGKNSSTAAEYINTNRTALDKRYASVVGASMPGPSNTFSSPISFSEAKSVFAPAPGIPSISSAMPSIPDAPPIITPVGSISSKKDSNNAVMPQEVGQDIKDRRIAHIVTGGLSG
ncbi:MAG: transglycosylase SLT domain-containing protein [Nitrosomonas sp.]|uniref:transglycosylase SLT domain-containing protein n=1 Tax=Nitrosomonas sp. TaxID=42353 RepID=UPI0025EB914A|nr:transglycosylase SLT domain-containing protein [Nitrosomonas sp.]MBY0475422.1 transglycosylase SLT domain-containing protein [Nitrosomonas sp.]